MARFFSLCLVLVQASPAFAIGTDVFGGEHWLIGATRMAVRVEAGETVFIRAVSRSGAAVRVDFIDAELDDVDLPADPEAAAAVRLPEGEFDFVFVVDGVERREARIAFDLEVRGADDEAQPGRLSALEWQLDSGTYEGLSNVTLFVVTRIGEMLAGWQVDMSGFSGWEFSLHANSTGVRAPFSGRSTPMAGNIVGSALPVFLEPPDLPFVANEAPRIRDVWSFDGALQVELATAGVLRTALDLDHSGVAGDSPGEILDAKPLSAGQHRIDFDQRDGIGEPIPSDVYDVEVTLSESELHFVTGDMEFCLPGVRILRLTPEGPSPARMHWDDALVDDGSLEPCPGPDGVLSDPDVERDDPDQPLHGWGPVLGSTDGPGDRAFMDTWVAGQRDQRTIEVRWSAGNPPRLIAVDAGGDRAPAAADPVEEEAPGEQEEEQPEETDDAGVADPPDAAGPDEGADAPDAGAGSADAGPETVPEVDGPDAEPEPETDAGDPGEEEPNRIEDFESPPPAVDPVPRAVDPQTTPPEDAPFRDPPAAGTEPDDGQSGAGCQSAPVGAGWTVLLLALGLRRRTWSSATPTG